MPGRIRIYDCRSEGNRIDYELDVSANIRKYFFTRKPWVKYDVEIQNIPSINTIPILSSVLPLAWLTGSDIEVDTIDSNYLEGVTNIQKDFKYMYPNGRFETTIHYNSAEINSSSVNELSYALNFSGGLDSTYTLIENLSLNPRLIMLFGADMDSDNNDEINEVKIRYSKFASRHGLKINFIETNARESLDEDRITHDFYNVLGAHFWGQLQIGMFHIGMVAPLSMNRFNRLLFASSVGSYDTLKEQSLTPLGAFPVVDEKIKWADLEVIEHGSISRHMKIPAIVKYLETNQLYLKVCLYHNSDNCCKCRKCLRTIFSLLLSGVDPNKCGFTVDNDTFNHTRQMMEKKALSEDIEHFWEEMKNDIPEDPPEIVQGYNDFCNWLNTFDLEKAKKKDKSLKQKIYYTLPYVLARPIYKILAS